MRSSLMSCLGERLDGLAVAYDRDVIGDAAHLVQLVRDEDRGDALALEFEQKVEQRLAVLLGQARRRLVEDQQPHFLAQRLGDLDQLLLADADIGDEGLGVLVQPHLLQQGAGARLVGVPVDDAVSGVLVAEEDVFGDRQHRHQREFLVDDDDALAFAVVDAFEVAVLPAIDDLAVIGAGRIDARQHLHQRRLAGAVLADHGVNFALLHAEVDVGQRLDAGKRLGDAAHLQNRGSHCG